MRCVRAQFRKLDDELTTILQDAVEGDEDEDDGEEEEEEGDGVPMQGQHRVHHTVETKAAHRPPTPIDSAGVPVMGTSPKSGAVARVGQERYLDGAGAGKVKILRQWKPRTDAWVGTA